MIVTYSLKKLLGKNKERLKLKTETCEEVSSVHFGCSIFIEAIKGSEAY